jgi:3-oxoadipate CoA-transferase beta subunit
MVILPTGIQAHLMQSLRWVARWIWQSVPKKVFITTDHVTKQGEPKIVAELTYPVTGKKCVDRIYTDLCVIDVTPDGLKVIEKVAGLSFEELQSMTGAQLLDATQG